MTQMYDMPFGLFLKVSKHASSTPYFENLEIERFLKQYGLESGGETVKHGNITHFRFVVTDPKLLTKFLLEWA